MAKKKFSRLSVMLEARDRMSNVFKKAANSSDQLSKKINSLNETVNKSRSTFVRASVQNRVLNDGYRQIAKTLGQTTNETNIFIRTFDKLPERVKIALYYTEAYTKALNNLLFKNRLVTTTTRMLTTVFKYTGIALWNISYAAQMAAKNFFNMTKAGKLLKLLVSPVTKLNDAIGKLVGKMWQFTKIKIVDKIVNKTTNSFKEMGRGIKTTLDIQKAYIQNTKLLARSTKAYQMLYYSIWRVKHAAQSTYMTFNLWKNTSRTVERISSSWNKLVSPIHRVGNAIRNLFNFTRKTNNEMRRFGGHRATFNQLADANARLNREVARLNSELAKANRRLGNMRGSLSSLNTIGTAFAMSYAAQAAYHTGERLAESTIKKAMEQDYYAKSIGILAGDPKKGESYYKKIQNYAATTIYSPEDWSASMRSFIGKAKNTEELETFMLAIEQLATLDPMQGLEGSAFAIREMLSGDTLSLVRRFELPKKPLAELKKIDDPIKQVEKMMEIVGKQTGFTVDAIKELKELPLMQWEKFKNQVSMIAGYIGGGAVKKIAPILEDVNKAIEKGKLEPFVDFLGTKLANFVQSMINGGKKIYEVFSGDKLAKRFEPVTTLWDNIKTTIKDSWPDIKTAFDNIINIGLKFVQFINGIWPTVSSIFQKLAKMFASFTGWLNKNFSWLLPIVLSLVAAFKAFKIVTSVISIFGKLAGAVSRVISFVQKAGGIFKALFFVLRANPIGIVVTLLVGLVTWIVTAYQTSETFREKVQKVIAWIEDKGGIVIDWFKDRFDNFTTALKGAWEWVGNLWQRISDFINDVKNIKIDWGAILPGGDPFISFQVKKEKPDGKHHGGISNVPHDNYKAILHKGERVLTREENKAYTNGLLGGVTVQVGQLVVREEADVDKVAEHLFRKLQENRVARGYS